VQTHSYQGRSVFTNGSQMISLEVRHAIFDGEAWERIIHLSGEPAEILRRGDTVNCLHPDSQMGFTVAPVGKVVSHVFLRQNFKLPKHYRLIKGGPGRIAGRYAHRLDIVPVDTLRYGYRLWLDDETGMLLKSIVINGQGKPLEVLEFVDLKVNIPLTKQDFAPGDGLRWSKQEVQQAVPQPEAGKWNLGWLPNGFSLARGDFQQIDNEAVSSKAYSDGLAAFTVFAEPYAEAEHHELTQIRGATVALSRFQQTGQGKKLVTLVGEIPLETALKVIASFQAQ